MSFHATVLTLFPEMFPGPLGLSLAGRALEQGIWSLEARDIRASATDRHRFRRKSTAAQAVEGKQNIRGQEEQEHHEQQRPAGRNPGGAGFIQPAIAIQRAEQAADAARIGGQTNMRIESFHGVGLGFCSAWAVPAASTARACACRRISSREGRPVRSKNSVEFWRAAI